MWNIEVPGLAKDIQPVVTKLDPQEITVVHCGGHQSQIPRSESGKGNHWVCIPTYKPQAILTVLGLMEKIPQPCYTKKENWSKNMGLTSQRGWYMLDEKIIIPQAQQCKVIKALYETTHDECEALWKALWNLLQRLWVKEWKWWWPRLPNHVTHVYKIIREQCFPLLHYLDPFNTKETTRRNGKLILLRCPSPEDTNIYW